jgi:AraC-like DNA-binding protein
MFGELYYVLLLCFVSGFTQCVLLGCAVFIAKYHRTYQFQKLFVAALVLHSFGFFNNFVVAACWNQPFSDFLNTLLIFYDYIVVGAYMMFAVSLVFPNKFRIWQLLIIEIPFVVAMLLFAVTKNPLVYPVIHVFTIAASLALMIHLLFSIKKYNAMLRDNVGDIECFDLRWSGYLCIILFVVQLFWALESVSQNTWFSAPEVNGNLLFDTLYCLLIMIVVVYVTRKIVQQKVFSVSQEEKEATLMHLPENEEAVSQPQIDSTPPSYHEVLIDKNIETLIREKRYYLDKTLTLQKLATCLATNRQYLSNYINQEKSMTFYDYINDFRLEEAKNLLDGLDGGRQYSIEEISNLSGFNSYSTFLRAFAKKYGQTPSKYLKNKR